MKHSRQNAIQTAMLVHNNEFSLCLCVCALSRLTMLAWTSTIPDFSQRGYYLLHIGGVLAPRVWQSFICSMACHAAARNLQTHYSSLFLWDAICTLWQYFFSGKRIQPHTCTSRQTERSQQTITTPSPSKCLGHLFVVQ